MRIIILLGSLALGGLWFESAGPVPPAPRAEIEVRVVASRVAGVAPLSVYFDAAETRADGVTKPLHHLYYSWDFDDGAAARRTASGPMAAHVFERAGRYRVALSVTGAAGRRGQDEITIDVAEPAAVFAGARTICFANDAAGFAGAPADAEHVVTTDFDAALDRFGSGRRLLFRRGDRFACRREHALQTDRATQLGAFGAVVEPDARGIAANAPLVQCEGEGFLLGVRGRGLRLTDLEFARAAAAGGVVDAQHQTEALLLLRLSARGFDAPVVVSPDIVEYHNADMHRGLFMVDCRWAAFGGVGAYLGAERGAVLGCSFGASPTTHVLRIAFARDFIVAQNDLADAAPGRHVLKLHAQQKVSRYGRYAERILIADNRFAGSVDWCVAVGPQNASSDEALRDVIIERNRLVLRGGVNTGLYLNSAATTVRNNVLLAEAVTSDELDLIAITRRGIEPVPDGVEVYHNTGYCAPASGLRTVRLVHVQEHGPAEARVANNLLAAPDGIERCAACGEGAFAGEANVAAAAPGLVDAVGGDVSLRPDAAALGSGVAVPVFADAEGRPRAPTAVDVGAYARPQAPTAR
ncbi:MAG: PKD domain-containing protein [Planctomycetota bacterium]